MLSVNAERAAPAATGRDPQAIDRHGGAINLPNNTASTGPARVGWPGILHDIGELWSEIEMLWSEIDALRTTRAACEMCGSAPCVNPSFCETCRRIEQEQPLQPPTASAPRPTPQTTIEALMHSVRERGLDALNEPNNLERLSRCDENALAEINRRLKKLGGAR
jgi:hypothetical protein